MANIIPADSAEFESAGDTGDWDSWFSSSVAQSTAQANNGTGSLAITATDSFAAIQLSNWPGWNAAPGEYRVSFAMFGPSGATPTLTLDWREGSSTLATTSVQLTTVTDTWVAAETTGTAPANTDTLWADLTFDGSSSGGATYYLDSVVADDEPAPSGTTYNLSGSASSTSNTSGAITAILALSGQAQSDSTATATVTATLPLAGSAASTTATAGGLGSASVLSLSGSAKSTTATSSALSAVLALTAGAESESSTGGTVAAILTLDGSASSVSISSTLGRLMLMEPAAVDLAELDLYCTLTVDTLGAALTVDTLNTSLQVQDHPDAALTVEEYADGSITAGEHPGATLTVDTLNADLTVDTLNADIDTRGT